jgi:hypothetical protein
VRPRSVYLALCVLGTVLPYSQFLAFVGQHGWAAGAFMEQLTATSVSRFFGFDVLVSAVVLWVFIGVEGKRCRVEHLWAPVAGTLTVGVSLGLPLFLYLRERSLEKAGA